MLYVEGEEVGAKREELRGAAIVSIQIDITTSFPHLALALED